MDMKPDSAQRAGLLRGVLPRMLARLHGGELSPLRLGLSVALGLFVGCTPLYGLHSIIAGATALALRLDALIAYLASNISLPPVIPLILFAEVQVGTLVMRGTFLPIAIEELSPSRAMDLGMALFVGSMIVGMSIALLGGGLAYAFGRRSERTIPAVSNDSI
jgi:uncharacterized protein (DUF2062 family)